LAQVIVVKLQLLLPYYRRSGRLKICIEECRILRHGSCIHGLAAAFPAGYFLASDWSSGTSKIYHPVENDIFRFVWSHHWQAVTRCGCLIPAQTHLESANYATQAHVSQSVVHCIFYFPPFSSCVLWHGIR
jgi:hypothetical protein